MAVEISANSAGLAKSLKSAETSLKGFTGVVSKVATAATLAFASISFASVGREVVAITAEFQKFEAVLTNTLGSKSEAQKALNQIQDFAAKTPFSVQELTASFVKLANQGFQPTSDEMRKLGDLAASTGKSFDQLTEAVIDAQAGEFERLKEFGIRASKQGDQVKFTFKGVETQTKFTSAAINEYLLSLGDLEGVSGSMAAISGTLGGSISNLGDSFDKLLLRVGNLTSGPLKFFIDQAQLAINTLATDLSGDTGATTVLEKINEQYVDSAKNVEQVNANLEELNRLRKAEDANYIASFNSLRKLHEEQKAGTEEFDKEKKQQDQNLEYLGAYDKAIVALTKKLEKFNEVTKVQALALIPALNAEIKRFEDLKNKSFSITEIGEFNNKIKELRDELDLLNATGSESNFLKNLNKNQTLGIKTELELPENDISENLFPTTVPLDVQPFLDGIKEMDEASAAFHVSEETRRNQSIATNETIQAQQERTNAAAEQFGAVVGDAFGRAAAGQITFKQALKQTTGEILKLFLQRALAGVIAGAAQTTLPPPVILALAAAGMAGISALFSSIGGPSGGGGGAPAGGPRTNVSRVTPEPLGNQGDNRMEFVIHGEDLITLANSQAKKDERRKG